MISTMLGNDNVLLWLAAAWVMQALELMNIRQPYRWDHLAVEDEVLPYVVMPQIGHKRMNPCAMMICPR